MCTGVTWPAALNASGSLVLDHGPCGYSCLVPAPLARGGWAACGGVLYEATGATLRFVRFPLDLKDAATCNT